MDPDHLPEEIQLPLKCSLGEESGGDFGKTFSVAGLPLSMGLCENRLHDRFRPQHKLQRAAVGNLVVIDLGAVERFIVEHHALHVAVFRRLVLGDN